MMSGRAVYTDSVLSQIEKIRKILNSIRQFEMQFGLIVAVLFKVATVPIKVFRFFLLLYLCGFPEALIIEQFHFSPQLFFFSLFRSDHRDSDRQNRRPHADRQTDQTINPVHQTGPHVRPSVHQPQIRSPHPNSTPDHRQIRQPNQTIRPLPPSDQTTRIRPQKQIPGCSASNQHSTPNLLKWYRSGAFLMGWVKGGIQSSG